MARTHNPETEAVNADSFLDIVASVVSIMIIMVLMSGLKIKSMPIDAPLVGEAAQSRAELTKDLGDEQSLRDDVLRTGAEIARLRQEAAGRALQRNMLALTVTTMEQRIQGARQKAEGDAKRDFGLAAEVAEARARLDELQRQQAAVQTVQSTQAEPVRVESYPTPISKAADREIWFQLRGGRLAHIPWDRLLEKFKADAERKAHRLADMPEMADTVGPEGGFRLRYTLERHEVTAAEAQRTGRGGRYVGLKHLTVTPVSDDLGETAAEALGPRSHFREVLADRRARGATITIWTYPDSFAAFRQIKKELHRLDFAVAARPLPEGTPISGSPEGTKSAAE